MCEAHLKPATSPTGYNHLIIVFAAPEEPSAASQWHCETIGRFGKSPFASVCSQASAVRIDLNLPQIRG